VVPYNLTYQKRDLLKDFLNRKEETLTKSGSPANNSFQPSTAACRRFISVSALLSNCIVAVWPRRNLNVRVTGNLVISQCSFELSPEVIARLQSRIKRITLG